jgi:AbrB family transcriptional regulator (stage V sporulation protein T)
MENRVAVNSAKTKKVVEVVEGEQISGQQQIIYPILSESDVIGTVIIFGKENNQELSDTENKIAGVAAAFLGRQMEG